MPSQPAQAYTGTRIHYGADTTASGGLLWNISSNGTISTPMTATSTVSKRVTVWAKGDPAGGDVANFIWPEIKVYVDGTLIATQTVNTMTWTTYRYARSRSARNHTLRIEFTNDAIVGTEDRNLKLDYAALYS